VRRRTERGVGRAYEPRRQLRDVALSVDDDRTVFRHESYAFHRRWVEQSPDRYQAGVARRIPQGEAGPGRGDIEKCSTPRHAPGRRGDVRRRDDRHPTVPVAPRQASPSSKDKPYTDPAARGSS